MNPCRSQDRRGDVSPVAMLACVSIIIVAGLLTLALRLRPEARNDAFRAGEIQVYCASGIARPVERALETYREQSGVAVSVVRTGGSGKLLGQIETEFRTDVTRGADLYVSADMGLLQQGFRQGFIAEILPMAVQHPVVATFAGSGRKASDMKDLVSDQTVRFGIANESAAIGRLARVIAEREGVLEGLLTRRKLEAENVMQLAQALQTRTIDAAVIWDTTVHQVNRQGGTESLIILARLDIPEGESLGNVAVGVVNRTEAPTAALRVARFLAARDGGLPFLKEAGFDVIDGDKWEEVPEIHLYCGSMFTPVFEQTVQEFATREGANIYPRWEGCGKLVATMDGMRESGMFPDAFLSCDRHFQDVVRDRFDEPSVISANELVIAIRRDTAAEVRTPNDLLDKSLRVGICHPEDSALGRITKLVLTQAPMAELFERLEARASVITDTGPTLVSQLLSGGLDAAIVYRSNVLADPGNADQLRIVPIQGDVKHEARAIQTWAIAQESDHRYLMMRLFQALTSDKSKSDFGAAGFQWLYPSSTAESSGPAE